MITERIAKPMFHVSRCDLGASVVLLPMVPLNLAKGECKETPRVCFAPTVEQCVMGMIGYGISPDITILGAFLDMANGKSSLTVYQTTEVLHEPEWISDYDITHEEWSLEPIEVVRIGYIDGLAMLEEKRIVLIDLPTTVNLSNREISERMTEEDRKILLRILEA